VFQTIAGEVAERRMRGHLGLLGCLVRGASRCHLKPDRLEKLARSSDLADEYGRFFQIELLTETILQLAAEAWNSPNRIAGCCAHFRKTPASQTTNGPSSPACPPRPAGGACASLEPLASSAVTQRSSMRRKRVRNSTPSRMSR